MIEHKSTALLSARKLQVICLTAAGLMELFLITCGPAMNYAGYYIVQNFLVVPGLVFLGVTLTQELTPAGKRDLLVGLGMVVWLTIAQLLHRMAGTKPANIGMWWSAYLLAFPFAAGVRKDERKRGFRIMAAIYVAAALTMSLYAALLMVDLVPGFLMGEVRWDGTRLMALWHPNIIACILMIGIALCLGACFGTEKKAVRGAALAAVAVQFLTLALTNCRTSILMTCALMAGVLFFRIVGKSWKRFAAACLAAVAAFVLLFALSDLVYEKNSEILVSQYIAEMEEEIGDEEEVELPTHNAQGALLDDLRTLNGRTWIWRSALRSLRADPTLLISGTEAVGETVSAGGLPFTVEHAHNSWAQILMGFGLPGLLFALYFTWMAVRDAFCLLFLAKSSMGQKCVSMLTLCILMAGFLEPMLFTGYVYYQFINLFFFLCVGYQNAWRQELREAARAAEAAA